MLPTESRILASPGRETFQPRAVDKTQQLKAAGFDPELRGKFRGIDLDIENNSFVILNFAFDEPAHALMQRVPVHLFPSS